MEQVKDVFITFYTYIVTLFNGMLEDIKKMEGQSLMFLAWSLISLVFGFEFSIIAMIIHSCYVHHMQDEICEVCDHESMLKYTIMICIGGMLHCMI